MPGLNSQRARLARYGRALGHHISGAVTTRSPIEPVPTHINKPWRTPTRRLGGWSATALHLAPPVYRFERES